MKYFCCDEKRRDEVRRQPGLGLNGIDFLEVRGEFVGTEDFRQRRLVVHFLHPVGAVSLTPAHFRITGGERVRGITVTAVDPGVPSGGAFTPDPRAFTVTVASRGDFSTYTLSLTGADGTSIPAWLDPQLAAIDFWFKVECESPFDCRSLRVCPGEVRVPPDLDYLAKDYASFRQLMFDRLSVMAPDWRERHAADLGVMLVEALAYVGDYLSYRQDAIGTEAYLGTARSRVSVRRHARLLDYGMHDGGNARVWVQVQLREDAPAAGVWLPRFVLTDPAEAFAGAPKGEPPLVLAANRRVRPTRFLTQGSGPVAMNEAAFERMLSQEAFEVFEPLTSVLLFPAHRSMRFHTWSDQRCCLPRGATKATLKDPSAARLRLRPGDLLAFVEQRGPRTGADADADPARRHVVRLTRVQPEAVPTWAEGREVARSPGAAVTDPLTGEAVVEIEWASADALPFALTLSARLESGRLLEDVTIVRGNLVAADHGRSVASLATLPPVPESLAVLSPVGGAGGDPCQPVPAPATPPRYRPVLPEGPVTQAAPFDPAQPAGAAFGWSLDATRPAVRLVDGRGQPWAAQRDLLASDALAREFVVEVENDGRARLRFGDDENGERPAARTAFQAWYRVGHGRDGNVGAETIRHVVAGYALVWDATLSPPQAVPRALAGLVTAVTNWLPARGGQEPETSEHARQSAPAAFREQRRAVTPQDYADKAALHPEVQRAVATRRWTGSWHTIYLTVDRRGGRPVDAAFERELRQHLERYRLAGHDLEIDGPSYVPLELELMACVEPHYFRGDLVLALRDVFGSQVWADGRTGFFHPDNFTFGQPVLVSRLYAAAQGIAGLRHLEVTKLRRQGAPDGDPLVPASGVLELGRLEIARLDNDANFPDRGVLRIEPRGGR